jgi:predicted nucleotide-binding protein with TIR-like domain
MRARVFVGSSTEGLPVAYAVQENLETDADVTVWTQDLFHPGEFVLESLLTELDRADVGILVFTADDLLRIRRTDHAAVRDNVLFEFGLFVGNLGRRRSFAVTPRGGPRLPTDLLGLNLLAYEPDRIDQNPTAALGPACFKIRRALVGIAPKASSAPREIDLPVFERRDLLSDKQRHLLGVFERDPAPVWDQLAAAVPDASEAELFYRLEQLRLLEFITADGSAPKTRYGLRPSYEAALEERRHRRRGTSAGGGPTAP